MISKSLGLILAILSFNCSGQTGNLLKIEKEFPNSSISNVVLLNGNQYLTGIIQAWTDSSYINLVLSDSQFIIKKIYRKSFVGNSLHFFGLIPITNNSAIIASTTHPINERLDSIPINFEVIDSGLMPNHSSVISLKLNSKFIFKGGFLHKGIEDLRILNLIVEMEGSLSINRQFNIYSLISKSDSVLVTMIDSTNSLQKLPGELPQNAVSSQVFPFENNYYLIKGLPPFESGTIKTEITKLDSSFNQILDTMYFDPSLSNAMASYGILNGKLLVGGIFTTLNTSTNQLDLDQPILFEVGKPLGLTRKTYFTFPNSQIRGFTSNEGMVVDRERNRIFFSFTSQTFSPNNSVSILIFDTSFKLISVRNFILSSNSNYSTRLIGTLAAQKQLLLYGYFFNGIVSEPFVRVFNTDSLSLGIQNILFAPPQSVHLFPNPTKGIFEFETTIEICNFIVSDQFGSVLTESIISGKKQINLSGFPDGFYFIKLTDNLGNCYVQKVLKYQ